LRPAHAYASRHGCRRDEMRAVAAVANLDPLCRAPRVSRLRGPGGGTRRARAPGSRSWAARSTHYAQPWAADLWCHRPASLQHDVSVGVVVPFAGRRDGRAYRAHDARRKRPRAHGAHVSAGRAATLRHSGMAGHAAPARCGTEEHRLPAVLALSNDDTWGR